MRLTIEVIGCLPLSAALTALAICNRRGAVILGGVSGLLEVREIDLVPPSPEIPMSQRLIAWQALGRLAPGLRARRAGLRVAGEGG